MRKFEIDEKTLGIIIETLNHSMPHANAYSNGHIIKLLNTISNLTDLPPVPTKPTKEETKEQIKK